MKTVKRLHHEKLLLRTKFLRQITFIKNWHSKDIIDFNAFLRIEEIKIPGSEII